MQSSPMTIAIGWFFEWLGKGLYLTPDFAGCTPGGSLFCRNPSWISVLTGKIAASGRPQESWAEYSESKRHTKVERDGEVR